MSLDGSLEALGVFHGSGGMNDLILETDEQLVLSSEHREMDAWHTCTDVLQVFRKPMVYHYVL